MTPQPEATPSLSPPFVAAGVKFTAWNVREGALIGSARTVWVSECGRIRCGGRVVPTIPTDDDPRTCRLSYWVRVDGQIINGDAGSLRSAMEAGALRLGNLESASAARVA